MNNFVKKAATIWTCLTTLLLCAAPTLHAATLAEVKQKGALRIAVYKDFPPYSYHDKQKLVGVDVALGQKLAEKLGVNADYMVLTAGENMDDDLRNAVWKGHYLGGGTADVMLHVPHDKQYALRNDKVRFFAPYAREKIVIAFNPEKIPDLSDLTVLADHKVGVELDSIGSTYLTSLHDGKLTASIEHFLDFYQGIQEFKSGKLAALVGMRGQIQHGLGDTVAQYRFTDVKMRGLKDGWDIGLAVKADNEELATELTKAIASLSADGVIKQIFTDYHIQLMEPNE